MNNKVIAGFKTPDFKTILLNLKSAKKLKATSPKKKKTVSKTAEKKLKAKEKEKKISSELKSIMKDVTKTVTTKNLETKDLKRKIIDLQAQSAVYNQDISMLLAAVGMLEAKPAAFASLTASLASGVEVVLEQARSLDVAARKVEVGCELSSQQENELERAVLSQAGELDQLTDDHNKLISQMSSAEDALLAAASANQQERLSELEKAVAEQSRTEKEHEEALADLLAAKKLAHEAVEAARSNLLNQAEATVRLEKLLKTTCEQKACLETDLAKATLTVASLRVQVNEGASRNKAAWADVDLLVEQAKKDYSKITSLRADVDHFNENVAHYANSVTKTSGKIESMREQRKEREDVLRKLKEYAHDLELMHSKSLHEVKVMRRTLYR